MIKVEAFTTSQFNAIENGAMPPKPFPFPLGVGVDLCQTKRIFSLLKVNQNIHAFSKKVFNRLEWPDVFEKFNHAALDIDNDGGIEPATGLILPDVSRWIPTSSRDFPRTHRLGTYLSGRFVLESARH